MSYFERREIKAGAAHLIKHPGLCAREVTAQVRENRRYITYRT
jgi:hypothetical protein